MVILKKQDRVELNYSLMIVNLSNLWAVSKLICNRKLKATTLNLIKNDCPLQCNKQHCDVCQFRDDNSERTQAKAVTVSAPSPEAYGRELYY